MTQEFLKNTMFNMKHSGCPDHVIANGVLRHTPPGSTQYCHCSAPASLQVRVACDVTAVGRSETRYFKTQSKANFCNFFVQILFP